MGIFDFQDMMFPQKQFIFLKDSNPPAPYNKDKIKQVATNLSKNLAISKGEQNYETKKRKTCIRQCCQNHQR